MIDREHVTKCYNPTMLRHMTVVRMRSTRHAIEKMERRGGGAELLRWGQDVQYYVDLLAVLDAYAEAHAKFKVVAGLVHVRRGLAGAGVRQQIEAVHRRLLAWFEEVV